MLALLESIIAMDRLQLRENPAFPPLYNSQIRYKAEGRDENGKTKEHWRTIAELHQYQGGDCEDLACARVAELREAGINARPWLQKIQGLWHVQVRWPDGTIEDPSVLLGMKEPFV